LPARQENRQWPEKQSAGQQAKKLRKSDSHERRRILAALESIKKPGSLVMMTTKRGHIAADHPLKCKDTPNLKKEAER
jgi:hypothetical protein